MRFVSLLIITAAVLCGFVLTGNIALGENVVLRSAGCKTEYFLFKDISQSFADTTGNKMLPAGVGNKKAINLLKEQKIDFAFTCKPLDKLAKKLQLNQADIKGWQSVAVAKDPIVVVVNRENGVSNLTTEQLTRIFAGQVGNWKEVGGNDIPILTAYLNPKLESGVVLLFKEFTVGSKGQLDPKARTGDGPSMLGNYVSLTPGSVTFMGFNSYKDKYGDITEIDGVEPSRANILNGSYPLAATYYITLDARENHGVNDFMQFIQSPEGKQSIDQNFIAVE